MVENIYPASEVDEIKRSVFVTVAVADKTMYNIAVEWDWTSVIVQDRYSNLQKLFSRLTQSFPQKNVPSFPPKLLIHTEAKLAERRTNIESCLIYLFSRIEIQELLDYLVSTGLTQE